MLSKPEYIKICFLELRKISVYQFHYDHIKNKYGDDSKLFFTDTYSLMYAIKTEDVMKISLKVKQCLTLVTIQPSQNTAMIQTN